MLSFANLPDKTLLLAFAYYDGRDYLIHLRDHFAQLGYRFVTKTHPQGREISRHDVRRRLTPLLKRLPAYPIGRSLRASDIVRIKIQVINQYDDSDVA